MPARINVLSLLVRSMVRSRSQKVLYYKGLAEDVSTGSTRERLRDRSTLEMVRSKKGATDGGGAKNFLPQEEVGGKLVRR